MDESRIPRPSRPPGIPAFSAIGKAALERAQSELGHGESGSNNSGPDVDRYRAGGAGGAWCAAFVSYCLLHGARDLNEPCPVVRTHGAKKLFARCIKAGRKTELPAPGDIVCWHRGAAGARTGHVGIVSKVEPDGSFWSIEGNRGGYPSKVRAYQHEIGEPLLLGFARLP